MAASILLASRKAEVRLKSPLPSDSWRRLQESRGLNLGVITCSLDVKQAFDTVSPENLSLVMKDMDIVPLLAGAILRDQMGDKYDICSQETRISGIPFDKSIKQGGKEISCLFNLMIRSVFRTLQEKWNMLRMSGKMRKSEVRQEEDRVSHMICAENCYLFAESKEHTLKMIADATEELKKRGLDWKEDQMELISWCLCKDDGDLHVEAGGKKYVIREVEALKAMGALISKEGDSTRAMKFRMNTEDKALWMDMKFYKNNGIAEGRKHKRYKEVVQSCILHSCEGWSWNKEMVDALHGWESRNLDLMRMESNGAEFGMVSCKSDQESTTKMLNIWCCREFGVTRKRSSTMQRTKIHLCESSGPKESRQDEKEKEQEWFTRSGTI